jgi:hypothetical protein
VVQFAPDLVAQFDRNIQDWLQHSKNSQSQRHFYPYFDIFTRKLNTVFSQTAVMRNADSLSIKAFSVSLSLSK